MIKMSGIGSAIARFGTDMMYSPERAMEELKMLRSLRDLAKDVLSKARTPELQMRQMARIQAIDKRISVAEAKHLRQSASSEATKGQAVGAAALGGVAAGGVGLGMLMDKINTPDVGQDEYKLARWVDGFMDKCAEHGVDGEEWLGMLMKQAQDVLESGEPIEKHAGLGSIFKQLGGKAWGAVKPGLSRMWGGTKGVAAPLAGGAMGGGLLGGAIYAGHETAKKNYTESGALVDKTRLQIKERRKRMAEEERRYERPGYGLLDDEENDNIRINAMMDAKLRDAGVKQQYSPGEKAYQDQVTAPAATAVARPDPRRPGIRGPGVPQVKPYNDIGAIFRKKPMNVKKPAPPAVVDNNKFRAEALKPT